jgi:hypothetical protein
MAVFSSYHLDGQDMLALKHHTRKGDQEDGITRNGFPYTTGEDRAMETL